MLFYLFLLLTVLPLTEIALLYWIGERIGVLATIGLVMATGILGAALAHRQGVATVARMQRELSEGRMPADAIFDGVIILLAGLLLVTPGVLTDAFGFMLLVPAFRTIVKNRVRRRFMHRIDEPIDTQAWSNDSVSSDRIIEVKVIESQ